MDPTWKAALAGEFAQPYFHELIDFIKEERAAHTIYPPPGEVFRAFDLTPLDKVRVVILGQDPYHGPGQAHGLAFSVRVGAILPPSLVNVFKEAQADVGFKPPGHGCLEHWAKQGVLLLNTVLTVRAKEPGSHRDIGWETFTDFVIRLIAAREDPAIFILWGSDARKKCVLIDPDKHLILEAAHPSPRAAGRGGFFGSKPFSTINNALRTMGQEPIDWQLPPP